MHQSKVSSYKASCPDGWHQAMSKALNDCMQAIENYHRQGHPPSEALSQKWTSTECRGNNTSLPFARGGQQPSQPQQPAAQPTAQPPTQPATLPAQPSANPMCEPSNVKATAYQHIKNYKGTKIWDKKKYKAERDHYKDQLKNCPNGSSLVDQYKAHRKDARKLY